MEKGTKIGLGVTAGLLLIAAFSKKKEIMEYTLDKVWDVLSRQKIDALHPLIREKAIVFLYLAEKAGYKLRITSGLRDHAEQQKLYNQGRTTPGKVVTNAKPGQSLHNFGLAIDVVPIVNGKADFNTPHWSKIAAIAKSVGFEWGGDWKGFRDQPHFEMRFNNSLAQLQKKWLNKELTNGYVNVA